MFVWGTWNLEGAPGASEIRFLLKTVRPIGCKIQQKAFNNTSTEYLGGGTVYGPAYILVDIK